MLDRVRLHGRLAQDFVATLELAEKLIVQVVSIGQKNQRRIPSPALQLMQPA